MTLFSSIRFACVKLLCLLLSFNIFVMAPFKKPITRNRINNFKVHVSRKARNSQLTGFLFRIFTGHVTLIYSASHPVYNVYLLLLYLLWLKLHTTYYYPTRLSSHYLGKWIKRLTHVNWITLRLKSSWVFWLQLFSSELLSLWMISHFNTMKGSEKRYSNISLSQFWIRLCCCLGKLKPGGIALQRELFS